MDLIVAARLLQTFQRPTPTAKLADAEARLRSQVQGSAEAILFLASDASRYITGTVLDVNGGLHMG